MSRTSSIPIVIIATVLLAACAGKQAAQEAPRPSAMTADPATNSTGPAVEDFWPTKAPPRCYTEGGLTRIVTGEAIADVDQAGSFKRRQPLAIAYNPATARNGGTGYIAVWSDYDSPGFHRWVCKEVNDLVIEMVRNGMGATIKVRPEPDGTVRDFTVVKLHTIHGFAFDIWREAATCKSFSAAGASASC